MLCLGTTALVSLADGWAFKNNVVIRNHRNLQDRLRAARLLLDRSPPCPVVVDSMENRSSQLYAALPDRLYVLQARRILYKVGPWGRRPGRAEGKEGALYQAASDSIAAQPFTSCATVGRSFPLLELCFLFCRMEVLAPSSQGMK